MQKPESSWIKIGEHHDAHHLREEVKKLRQRWPERWELVVVPKKCPDSATWEVYLKHR